jgi:hypothetical protein
MDTSMLLIDVLCYPSASGGAQLKTGDGSQSSTGAASRIEIGVALALLELLAIALHMSVKFGGRRALYIRVLPHVCDDCEYLYEYIDRSSRHVQFQHSAASEY